MVVSEGQPAISPCAMISCFLGSRSYPFVFSSSSFCVNSFSTNLPRAGSNRSHLSLPDVAANSSTTAKSKYPSKFMSDACSVRAKFIGCRAMIETTLQPVSVLAPGHFEITCVYESVRLGQRSQRNRDAESWAACLDEHAKGPLQ